MNEHKCTRCKISITGGFYPTGFCFLENGPNSYLCRECSIDFQKRKSLIIKALVLTFLAESPIEEPSK